MGCDVGDLNNDGHFDLLAADMAGTSHYREKMAMGSMDAVAWFLDAAEPRQYMRNSLFINTGTPRFLEAAHLARLASSDWTWSVKIADFDNDGREDVYFTNGFTRDYLNSDFNNQLKKSAGGQRSLAWYDAPRLEEQNHAFRNQGNLSFSEVSAEWGLDDVGISFGAAVADLDKDGDLDIVVNNFEASPSIYRNGSKDQTCCKIKLIGTSNNRQGIGATVQLKTESESHVRYHNPSGGFLSCDESIIHVGLGVATVIQELSVRWPNGNVQQFANVPANHLLTITEPTDHSSKTPPSSRPLFVETDKLAAFSHRETPFDDFAQQPLLPNKLSQLGPGMALGDINKDGLPDLFVGGAAGEPGQLLVQTESHTFVSKQLDCLQTHRATEDMGCLLLDVDGDKDLDLFVVSGGVESELGSANYRDRLYLNVSDDNEVQFRRAPNAIPDLRDSGGPVAAADFDQDGDLDLFVGGRVVPGQYPTPPQSRLLRNDQGEFVEVKGFDKDLGMVTGAIWSDFDDDGWLDLLLTNDYGPIRVLKNEEGQFEDVSNAVGTGHLLGWWNSITGCDVDLDGDTDYVVGNLGTNTKYHPTDAKPQHLFYGNFQGGNRNHIVEAKTTTDGLLPTRGRSCSCNAMPFIAEKFETFHGFASASLNDIYSESRLQQAQRVTATVVHTGVLINQTSTNGERGFAWKPLPVLAQMSPVFGIEIIDANGDHYPDLFLAQNLYTPQRETGRMAGGVSCIMIGQGDGTFAAMPPSQTGLVIPEDAKSTLFADLDKDGRQELVVATNNGAFRTFSQTSELGTLSQSQNSTADPTRQKIEHYLGSGYLSSGSSPWIRQQ